MSSIRQQRWKELNDLAATFATDGFTHYVNEMRELHLALIRNADDECKTNDEWQYRRGQLAMLKMLRAYPDQQMYELETFDEQVYEDEPETTRNPLED